MALITEAGSGMGRSTAELFAQEGARVVVVDIDEAGGAQTVATIRAAGGEAIFTRADVADFRRRGGDQFGDRDLRPARRSTQQRGIGEIFEDMSEEEWDWLMGVNLKAIFWRSIRGAAYEGAGRRLIINTGSTGSLSASAERRPISPRRAA